MFRNGKSRMRRVLNLFFIYEKANSKTELFKNYLLT